ncbi:MAG: hypothetical protein L0287_06650 [Anaerolineae bacterium]|nr:hypothetical protein [Anaerolineae bacterium]
MAQMVINIPDGVANRVVNGLCKRYNYSDTLEHGEPNPETKAQFAKRKVVEFIKRAVRDVEIESASKAAGDAAGASADIDIVLS